MLKELLTQYDACSLECDGLTRVLHTVLSQQGIEHSCMVGSITYDHNRHAPLHFWIELSDHQVIDYRARMWLGDTVDVPHGIFDPNDFPQVKYKGTVVDLDILPQYIFDILTASNSFGNG